MASCESPLERGGGVCLARRITHPCRRTISHAPSQEGNCIISWIMVDRSWIMVGQSYSFYMSFIYSHIITTPLAITPELVVFFYYYLITILLPAEFFTNFV